MKQNWTMYIYKTDKRTKTGERLFSTTVWQDRDAAAMKRECNELYDLYPATKGWRMEYFPTMTTVKSMMTGAPVEILTEHVGSFMDPSQERYWSM